MDRANKTLKDDYTLRVKLGMADLNNMEEAVTSWSLNEGRDSFKGRKTYCLRDWTGAWQWHTANPQRFRVLAQTCPGACPTALARVRSEFGRLVFVATSNALIHIQIMAPIGDLSGSLQDIPQGSSALAPSP